MLCPVLVGRTDEVGRLRRRIEELQQGRGGVVVVVGEPGIGKSRLVGDAAQAARELDLAVLVGRAVPSESPIPYRPLSEAFASALRDVVRPHDAGGRGLAAHFGRFVPAWATGDAPVESETPVVLGEVAVQLLRLAGGQAGAVLVLEDLHWADAETLEVLDYLAGAASAERMLCICTARTHSGADELIERLRRRDPHSILELERLSASDLDRMVAECLEVELPLAGLDEFLLTHSDGVPFVVEELLAGLVAAGELRRDGSRWLIGDLHARVPSSLRDSIRRRLVVLNADAQRVLGAAALLGRAFEWELLPGIAEVDGPVVVEALRSAIDQQVIEPDGRGFRFRHALTREAVLDDLLAPERHALAVRAWPSVERAHPGLPGPTCELAAELAELAGAAAAAAERLVISARRALGDGALATAEATARRAVRLAVGEPASTVAAERVLLDVLVAAGKPADALSVGRTLLDRIKRTEVEPVQVADLHLAIARAAISSGALDIARGELDAARRIATSIGDPTLSASSDVISAHLALNHDDLATAEKLAQRALDGARATMQPAIECDALLVLGRIERTRSTASGNELFSRAAAVARAAGLAAWHLRAEQELSIAVWLPGGFARIRHTRSVATRYGAISAGAVLDLILADLALMEFDTDACLRAARECADASHRYRLATESVAHLWLAGAHALAGDSAAMQTAINAALAADADDPRILGDLYGRVLVAHAIVEDRLADLPRLFEQMVDQARRAPDAPTIFAGRILHALLDAADDHPDGGDSRAVLEQLAVATGIPMIESAVAMVDAVRLGRGGDPIAAMTMFSAARDTLLATTLGPALAHTSVLFIAPVALRDGWGDPVGWLRAAEAFFGDRGHERVARRCRLLLGAAGAPMPRRGRGDSEVPASLRALGITSREVDVLKLVAAGRTNRAIAEELMLSPKTVERHLSSLFVRAGVSNRHELGALAVSHLGEPER